MTSVNLPGFSAEVSLARQGAQYQQAGWNYAFDASGEVVHQAEGCVCTPDGTQCCCCTAKGCKCVTIGPLN